MDERALKLLDDVDPVLSPLQVRLLAEILRSLTRLEERLAPAPGPDVQERSGKATCPHCGSTDLENTTCMGETYRLTCRECGRTHIAQEPALEPERKEGVRG